MTNSPTDLKLAILLNTLGHEAADAALSGLPAERTAAVRQHLEEFEVEQPSLQAIEAALDEFEVFLNFAVDTLQLPARIAPSALDSGFGGRPQPPKTELKIFEPTDDPFYDLNRLNPGQIAAALAQEPTRRSAIAGMAGILEHLGDSREAAELMLESLGVPCDSLVAREDAAAKPDPEGLLKIARRFDLATADMLCVGDFLYDLQAAAMVRPSDVARFRDERSGWDQLLDSLEADGLIPASRKSWSHTSTLDQSSGARRRLMRTPHAGRGYRRARAG